VCMLCPMCKHCTACK